MGPATPETAGADPRLDRRALLLLAAGAAMTACSPSRSGTPAGRASSVGAVAGQRPAPTATSSPTSLAKRPAPRGPAAEITHGPRTVPAVALTFHGAGDPRLAERILVAAERAGVSVTVLAVGTWLTQRPDTGKRILSGGHELGNHTWHHRPMLDMAEPAAVAEIVGGLRIVRRFVTGPTWFRPSGTTHATAAILAAAGRAGYATSLSFDVDPRDYTDPGPAAVTSRVLSVVTSGSVVSLHLGHAGTADAIPTILSGLDRLGLRPVTVSRLLTGIAP